ncbi:unnamed protein product [Caenorhabditis bovis]|uniref:Uncharacterized protein n=1 Tax=Caenorhabditis bovis TaxID=2654633 RepID=A0A8S1EJ94_9PELO|nr:unnamed protein product [Caenorhabditis bovis]
MSRRESVSVLDAGDGMFKTHVHLDDVQKVIKDELNTEAQLGPKTKYTVIGDGNGFMSRVVHVEPDWTVNDENLPKNFVLKINSAQHVHTYVKKLKDSWVDLITPEQEAAIWDMLEGESKMLHNREVNMLKILKKWNRKDDILNPDFYFSLKFDDSNPLKGFMGMEMIENSTVHHIYQNATPEELYPVLKALATLQALSLDMTQEDIDSIQGYSFKKLMGPMLNEKAHIISIAAKQLKCFSL